METKSKSSGKHDADPTTSADRRCWICVAMFVLLLVVYRTTAGFGYAREHPISWSPVIVSAPNFKNLPPSGSVLTLGEEIDLGATLDSHQNRKSR